MISLPYLQAIPGLFLVVALLAAVQTLAFLMGAMLALGLAGLATHPLLVLLARRHKAWDATHDLIFFLRAPLKIALTLALLYD
jgi:hypothetical protein